MLKVHVAEAVALADRLMGADGQVTVKPSTGLGTEESVMVPEKLSRLVSVTGIVDPTAPLLKLTGVPVLIEKSPTRTVMVVEFVTAFGPVPLMVTV